MTYEYTTRRPVVRSRARLSGMGYSAERGRCDNPSGGATRCFRATESAIATRMNCNNTATACTVSNASGTMWCCPTTEAPVIQPTTSAPSTSTTSTSTGVSTNPKEIRNTSEVNLSTISDSKITEDELAQHASSVARQVADTEYDSQMPIESDSENEQQWYERYSTHITIGSTVIGLGTFLIWLAVRKR
jgi:hypothetical protein